MGRHVRRQALTRAAVRAALAALALQLVAPARVAFAEPVCAASPELFSAPVRLPRAAAALAAGRLAVVAIGSSSTRGHGASTPDRAYPAQLERDLRRRFPESRIAVANRGVGGETVDRMVARMEADALAEAPHLVLWQLGTNAALRRTPLAAFRRSLDDGLDRLAAAGADVLLIGPQLGPRMAALPDADAYQAAMEAAAAARGVAVLRRATAMRRWLDEGADLRELVDQDGLHMRDLAYACLARLIGDAIQRAGAAASPPDAPPR